MIEKQKILLATSIVPYKIEWQIEALKTWQEIGCEIVSINSPDEINILQDKVKDIELISIESNGNEIYGKPLIYIKDILNYLRDRNYNFSGIINSDIYLKENTSFKNKIINLCQNSVLLLPRINVDALDKLPKLRYKYGFDVFFSTANC